MGNIIYQVPRRNITRTETSQFSVSNLFGSSSGRFLARGSSFETVYCFQRSSSLVPQRRFTNLSQSESHKTLWPVSRAEAIFLPEFPVSIDERYRELIVGGALAKGAYGKVYKVGKEGKDYACKVLSKAQVLNESAVSQVKEEAKIQQLCGHHEFIVDFVSRWQTKKHLYILLEFVCGGVLFTLLQRCKVLPEKLVQIYVAELAIAIEFLHNAGVIHRDVKPENVLLDARAHLKLTDFGLSRWLARGSRTSTVCGTEHYMVALSKR